MVGTGRIWFEFPTLIAFSSLYQLRRGAWRSPCKDVLIILSVCAVFVYFYCFGKVFYENGGILDINGDRFCYLGITNSLDTALNYVLTPTTNHPNHFIRSFD